MMIDDSVVCMVQLEQVLERSSSLFGRCFNIVDFNTGEINGGAGVEAEDPRKGR